MEHGKELNDLIIYLEKINFKMLQSGHFSLAYCLAMGLQEAKSITARLKDKRLLLDEEQYRA
ncbi:hypothetical protein [Limoniibacter endophyticus]|uniref:Uncharacterized protein n=1 Tax=Limoniibacter endophyticus TaxID=1565040 RepID=A0A8J3DSX6_9HYPH|nr:hypothetical protein [Limoniibacter endophyticus]GHC79199.1 hypothetical protein GCM10010136_31570 [Limoniibacter endophyticus]